MTPGWSALPSMCKTMTSIPSAKKKKKRKKDRRWLWCVRQKQVMECISASFIYQMIKVKSNVSMPPLLPKWGLVRPRRRKVEESL